MPMNINSSINTIMWLWIAGLVALMIGTIVFKYYIGKKRREYEASNQFKLTFLQIKLPPQNEIEIKAAEHMFSSFMGFKKSFWDTLKTGQHRISFEIVSKVEGIAFYVVVPDDIALHVEKQINAAYPTAEIDIIDPEEIWDRGAHTAIMELGLSGPDYYPIKNHEDIGGDALSAITSSMSKLGPDDVLTVQFLVKPASENWRKSGKSYIGKIKNRANDPNKQVNIDTAHLEGVEKKISKPGFDTVIRVVSISSDKFTSDAHLRALETAFEQFTDVNYNRFVAKRLKSSKKFIDDFIHRRMRAVEWFIPLFDISLKKNTSVLNISEMATVFHFPNKNIQTPNIIWLGARKAPAPANVPKEGILLGQNQYRGTVTPVHMKDGDRRRHMYIIGQTGTGKSEFLKALVLQDIKAGKGVALIDPHGSDIDDILQRIPEERKDDVILFDVSDTQRPLGLNILEWQTEEQKNMLINAFIGLLYKLYDPNRQGIIGPKLERAVRNIMLTAMVDREATLVDVLRLLIDNEYSKKFLPLVKDPLVKRYWTDEVAKTSDFHKSETMGYFVSKFDRFITESTMRNILGQPKSALDFSKIMAEKKIFLADLSKGKIGEENATFLGLIIVPRILMAALQRATLLGQGIQFPDFYLYVDEFQNFATPDFATILSEARKYKLNLIVANQFIAQLSDEIKTAIFGNVGTMASFRIGIDDSEYLATQFSPIFEANDLINNPMGSACVRLLIDGHPSIPFSMQVPWDKERNDLSLIYGEFSKNQNIGQEIRQRSRMTYGRPVAEVEEFINKRAGFDEPPIQAPPQLKREIRF